jgi:hypothetical protein
MKKENKSTGNSKKKKSSAIGVASVGRSATEHAHRHSNTGLASTGTNISYEGATAPGAGGSAGTGYASGKEATGETIRAASDYNENRIGNPSKIKNAVKEKNVGPEDEGLDEESDLDEDNDRDKDDDLDKDLDVEEEDVEEEDEEIR